VHAQQIREKVLLIDWRRTLGWQKSSTPTPNSSTKSLVRSSSSGLASMCMAPPKHTQAKVGCADLLHAAVCSSATQCLEPFPPAPIVELHPRTIVYICSQRLGMVVRRPNKSTGRPRYGVSARSVQLQAAPPRGQFLFSTSAIREMHLNYVAGYTGHLLFLFERTHNYSVDNQGLVPWRLRRLGRSKVRSASLVRVLSDGKISWALGTQGLRNPPPPTT